MEEVTIIKVATMPDHVHMYVSIPPKLRKVRKLPKGQKGPKSP